MAARVGSGATERAQERGAAFRAEGGNAIYARVGPGIDKELGTPDGFSWSAPWGTIKFDWTGFHIVHVSGAEFHLGGIDGMPAPLDQLGTYCNVVCAGFTTTSSTQAMGAGAPTPLAFAVPVISQLSEIQAQLGLVGVALAKLGAVGANASAADAITTAAEAIVKASAGLAAVIATVPAGTSSS